MSRTFQSASRLDRRALLRGLTAGVAGIATGSLLPPTGPAAALPAYVSGSAIQTLLDNARDKKGARDSAGRYIAKPPRATYLLTKPLVIYGNTHLDATDARIVARFPATGVAHTMLLNSVASGAGGYAGSANIAITGGSWDPVWDFVQRGVLDDAPAMNVITMIHASDVLVDGVTIWNVKWWHAIELNAVRHGTVQNSTLNGWIRDPSQGLWHGEAIQLDLPAGINTWGGLSDKTPCQDIVLRDNSCDTSGSQLGWGQLTGSHTSDAGHPHSGLRIEGNTVRHARWDAIATVNARDVHITGNVVENCEGGIYVKSIPDAPLSTVEIVDNQVSGVGGRDAIAVRADPANAPVSDVLVTGNGADCSAVSYYGDVRFRPTPQPDCPPPPPARSA